MTTTTLVVEIIIIGFQALIWLSLLILVLFGFDWINLDKLQDWATPISLVVVAVSYTTGMIFDVLLRVIFSVLHLGEWDIYQGMKGGENHDLDRMLVVITTESPEMANELQRRFNQTKLARATVINLLLITLFGCIFYVQLYGFSWKWLGTIGSLLVLFSFLAYMTWYSSLNSYFRMLDAAYNILKPKESQNDRS